MDFKIKQCLIWFTLLLAVVACQRKLATSSTSIPANGATEAKVEYTVIKTPSDFESPAYRGLRFAEDVLRFYRHREYEPFWLEKNVRSALADSMITIIRSARRYGLLPQRYHAHEIPELVLEPMNRDKMVRLDILLTDAFLSIASDLKRGRINRNTITADSTQIALLTTSMEAHEINDVLSSQEPVYEGYQLLKQALNNILDTINITEQNLLLYGYTNDSIESHRKIQRIEINLERWRNEKEQLTNLYTWINVPAFMFYVVENHLTVMESKVIVGKPDTPTPLFSSKIDCFVIFPYWYVPRKIAVEEYLHVIQRDTTFIPRNNFDVLDRKGNIVPPSSINWEQYNANNFPFVLRQREGSENSLGIIKFVFDNPYAVFLHDTNAKRLFKNNTRAYSHGCIRLEKAFQFAHYLIDGGRTAISSRSLDKYLKLEKRMTISLNHPLPIHIRYFTCDVTNGQLHFYPDVYKRDNVLIKTIYEQTLF